VVVTPGTAMGHVVVAVGVGTTSLGVWVDGRFRRRIRVRHAPGRLAVPLPVGLHDLRVRARGRGGARWAPARSIWVLPRSAQRAKGIGGRVDARLQRDLDGLVPAEIHEERGLFAGLLHRPRADVGVVEEERGRSGKDRKTALVHPVRG